MPVSRNRSMLTDHNGPGRPQRAADVLRRRGQQDIEPLVTDQAGSHRRSRSTADVPVSSAPRMNSKKMRSRTCSSSVAPMAAPVSATVNACAVDGRWPTAWRSVRAPWRRVTALIAGAGSPLTRRMWRFRQDRASPRRAHSPMARCAFRRPQITRPHAINIRA